MAPCRAKVGEREFADFFKFAFVRDPLTRAVSAFNFLKRGGMSEFDAEWASANLGAYSDFNAFAVQGLQKCTDWWHFRPQNSFLTDAKGNLALDFVGRYETLPRDFGIVAKAVNPDARLDHFNRSEDSEPTIYSPAARKAVRSIYRRDYRLFYPGEAETTVRDKFMGKAARFYLR